MHAILLTAVTLLPAPLGLLSWGYAGVALLSGAWFTWWVVKSMRADDRRVDYQVFKVSIAYLFLVFGAMLGDQVVRAVVG